MAPNFYGSSYWNLLLAPRNFELYSRFFEHLCNLDRWYIHVVMVAFSNRLHSLTTHTHTHTHTRARARETSIHAVGTLAVRSRSVLWVQYASLWHSSLWVHYVQKLNQHMWRYSSCLWSVKIFSRRVAAPARAPRELSVTVGINQCICIETRTVSGRSVTAVSAVSYCMPHWYRCLCCNAVCRQRHHRTHVISQMCNMFQLVVFPVFA